MSLTFSPSNLLLGPKFVALGILPNHKRYKQRHEKFRSYCENIVEQCRKDFQQGNTTKRNLVQAFFEAQVNNPEETLTTSDIMDEFITFFAAGMDTTGQLVTMMLYYLDKYPEYYQKVKEEVDHYLQDESQIDHNVLNQMIFTGAFVKEILRVAPPTPTLFFRLATVDHKLGSLKIKKGTAVNIGLIVNSYNPKFYEDAHNFRPERWLEADTPDKKDPFAYLPFSAGSRNCIGQHLAVMEGKIIMGLFLKTFDFKVSEGYKLRMIQNLLYEPLEPVTLNLKAH